MRHIFKLFNTLAFTAILVSCSFFDVTPQVICSETFYKTEAEVQYGLAGIYGVMNCEPFYGNYYSLMFANIDDLSYCNRAVSTDYSLQYNLHSAGTSRVYDMWTIIFKGISNANYFMEAVSGSEFDADGQYYNEARFMRAYYYFILGQAWGDVPLLKSAVKTPDGTMCPATPQYDVLTWVASEMEECAASAGEDDLAVQPSRVTRSTMHGILARVYLFLAGESVKGGDKHAFLEKARDHAYEVIRTGLYHLNRNYETVFTNMMSDKYDTEYHESMWEVDFLGDRTVEWTGGRIGDLLGLQSGTSASTNFSEFNCNFAYGMYNGSLQLWNLYWKEDRVADEYATKEITDRRQAWNLPPYNYAGHTSLPPYPKTGTGRCEAGIDKTPYVYEGVSTSQDATSAKARRNCGKFRREIEWEGKKTAKLSYTSINYPLLRYADVLLMYAEASNELDGPTEMAYGYVKDIRTRAGIKTKDFAAYDMDSFRQLVRNERGRELCFESLRRFDLIRWGIYVEEMNAYAKWTADPDWSEDSIGERAALMGSNTKPMHVLLPIPSIEIGVNTELKQNSLWAN